MKFSKGTHSSPKKLLRLLENDMPAWKDTDHPELANGAAAWVRELRQENEHRQRKAKKKPSRSKSGTRGRLRS
jgi:hypothetical protein